MPEIILVKSYKTSEAQRKASRKWNEAHREEHLQMKRNWNKQNPEKYKASKLKSRIRAKLVRDGFKELAAINLF